jgi:hypothetical protein
VKKDYPDLSGPPLVQPAAAPVVPQAKAPAKFIPPALRPPVKAALPVVKEAPKPQAAVKTPAPRRVPRALPVESFTLPPPRVQVAAGSLEEIGRKYLNRSHPERRQPEPRDLEMVTLRIKA